MGATVRATNSYTGGAQQNLLFVLGVVRTTSVTGAPPGDSTSLSTRGAGVGWCCCDRWSCFAAGTVPDAARATGHRRTSRGESTGMSVGDISVLVTFMGARWPAVIRTWESR